MQDVLQELRRQGEQIGHVLGKLSGIEKDIETHERHIAELRVPNKVPLLIQGGLAVFLLTVIGLLHQGNSQRIEGLNDASVAAFAGLRELVEDHEARGVLHKGEFRDHVGDGHSSELTNDTLARGIDLLTRTEQSLREKIEVVDKAHAAEHIEQEEDIAELRHVNERVEKRLDALSERTAVLETRFGRVVGMTPQGFHMKDWQQVGKPLESRISRLENLIFTMTNGSKNRLGQ